MCGTAEARLMSDTSSGAYVIDEDYTIVSFNDTITGLYPPSSRLARKADSSERCNTLDWKGCLRWDTNSTESSTKS